MFLRESSENPDIFFQHLQTTNHVFLGSGTNSFHGALPLLELFYILFIGSTGPNRTEIEKVFPEIEKVIPEYRYNYSLRNLIHSSESSTVGFGSGIAVLEKNFALKDSFTKDISEIFGASTFDISHLSDREKVSLLNEFVEKETHQMIEDFFSEDDIKDVSLVIFNALFFSLRWSDPFDPNLTEKNHPFRAHCVSSGDSYSCDGKVDMMINPSTYVKVKSDDDSSAFTMFELPFEDGDTTQEMTAVFLMPHGGIKEFEEKYDVNEEVRRFANDEDVEWKIAKVGVPRMKITHKEKLKEHVKERLGLTKMFDRSEGFSEWNFGNIIDDDLWVDQIMQAGTIEVNETGVKVAVVTAAMMVNESACMGEKIILVLDSEFLIIFQWRGVILFKGYFYNKVGSVNNSSL